MLVSDFETRNETPASVWLWGVSTLDKNIVGLGYDIESFFAFIRDYPDDTYFFHNAKFDCSFIADYAFRNIYKIEPMLNRVGMLFSLTLWFGKKKIRFYDSMKFAKGSLGSIADSLKLQYRKREMDYDKKRPIGYRPDADEMEYFKSDLFMLAEVVDLYMGRSTAKTLPARSYASFISMFGKDKKEAEGRYYSRFPRIGGALYKELHNYYRGGIVLRADLAKNYKGPSSVWDVNSEYPFVCMRAVLPKGSPIPFKGKPKELSHYPLFLTHFRASFRLKPGRVPFLYSHDGTIGGDGLLFEKLDLYELWITSMEFKRFQRDYEVFDLEYIDGYYFRGEICPELVKYMTYWSDKKRDAKTPFDRQEAKDHMNTLTGKFGANPERMKYTPYLDANNAIRYEGAPIKERYFDCLYIPMSIFILAYARLYITYHAKHNYERLLYIDTDSLHLVGHEVGRGLDCGNEIGQFKLEHKAEDSRYFGVKTYAIEEHGRESKEFSKGEMVKLWETGKMVEVIDIPDKEHLLVCPDWPQIVDCRLVSHILIKMSGLHAPRLYKAGKEVAITKLEDLDGKKELDFRVKRAKIVE